MRIQMYGSSSKYTTTTKSYETVEASEPCAAHTNYRSAWEFGAGKEEEEGEAYELATTIINTTTCILTILGEPNHNLDKIFVPEAMFQSAASPLAIATAPSQIAALQQIQALMAIQMQQNNVFPAAEDSNNSIRLSPNSSNHSDGSVASTSKDHAEIARKSPKCE
uniref:Uncharacterized protein n=1 Tax=Caenorhabditis japonica TaxID=281687 RepID=A0A8R1IF44_CAEJA